MEQSYEIPTKEHNTKKERNIFWDHIIEEQKASGMSAPKFCQQHQIPFSMFRNRQYRLRLKARQKPCDKQIKDTTGEVAGQNRFVQVQIAEEVTCAPVLSQDEQYIGIKIIFKNCHIMEITWRSKQEDLSAIIEQIARLPC